MANLATDIAWTRGNDALAGRLMRRLHVLARYVRIKRGRRRALRLVLAESLDSRLLEDIGIDPYLARRHAWRGELARAMCGSHPPSRWHGG